MIYIDSSVALAQVLAEKRMPPERLWDEQLISSRLLVYEVWNRIHSLGLGERQQDEARLLLSAVGVLELLPSVLQRPLEPFPVSVRTLDSLHLASMIHF